MPDKIKPTMDTSAPPIDPTVAGIGESTTVLTLRFSEPVPNVRSDTLAIGLQGFTGTESPRTSTSANTPDANGYGDIWKFTMSAPNPDSPWNGSALKANLDGMLDKDEPLGAKTPAAKTAFRVLIYDINWDFVDQVAMGTTARTPTQSTLSAAKPDGVIDQDKPLGARTPAAQTAFNTPVQVRNHWDYFVDQVVGDAPAARPATQSTLLSVPNPDSPWNDSGIEANSNGVIDQGAPLDARTPAAKAVFKVLVYDTDWSLADKLVVDATAQAVTLNVDPATSNDYWVQNNVGTWLNLTSTLYGGKMVIEGGRLRLDFPTPDGGPLDADGAAGHAPLSLMGQVLDSAHGGFWL
ncbi:hypothetical protein [Verminephrobacter aporrectodeae]|uniref:hypothetical protein n=1 Tax=Verminephrobacter aporrectodeae TaxID=1110389 RepID=UPI002238AF2A|nr:hypothetical protein [Verminephrobacter aporrectodeae]